MTCPVPDCDNAAPDGLPCRACTNRLRADLAALPELLRELEVTITRQSRTGPGGRSSEIPLPVNLAAADTAWAARNTLSTWVRELELGDADGLPDRPAAWCGWMGRRIERIRGHADAGMICDEIGYCVVDVRRVIDLPPDRRLAGTCEVCGEWLYAAPDAVEVTCRKCRRAGIESVCDVAKSRARMLDDAKPFRGTPLEVAGLVRVATSTLRGWVRRGWLDVDGAGHVEVGQALLLAETMAERVERSRDVG